MLGVLRDGDRECGMVGWKAVKIEKQGARDGWERGGGGVIKAYVE